MRKKIPKIYRNIQDNSITLSYGKQKSSLIWLHGLCSNSDDFFPFFTHSHSPLYHDMRIKLIQAPLKRITINNNEVCNSWYDLRSYDRFVGNEKDVFNFDDIEDSYQVIDHHVKEEAEELRKKDQSSGVDYFRRVFIGGFSQGGVMSLHYSLQSKNILAGCIALSSYLLRSTPYKVNLHKLPILLMHGSADPIIREAQALKSYENIFKDTNLVYYKSVPNLQHTVNLEQIDELSKWLQQINSMILKCEL